jgi:branched-chain amino acid aminotransferase
MSIPITPQEYMWLDGRIVPWGEAKIHIMSHALHYGTGVFEGIRAFKTEKGAAIFRLKEHLGRFYDSAKPYRIKIPYEESVISGACTLLLRKNRLEDSYIRPIAFKDCMAMGLNSLECPTRVAIAAYPCGKYLGRAYTEGAMCIISSWRRTPSFCSWPWRT